MEFGQAVPLRLQRQYSEGTALASARDSRSNSQLWKGNKVTQQWQVGLSQSVSKLSREVAKMRRKPLGGGGIGGTSAGANYPFQIYNIANFTDTTLNKYTFQIRGGLIGFRSAYNIPGGDFAGTMDCYGENWEMPLIGGTDDPNFASDFGAYQYLNGGIRPDFSAAATQNQGGSVTLDAGGAATLICENYIGTATPPNVQIVIPVVGMGAFAAVFWIEIVDDATLGCYTQLYGEVTADPDFSNIQSVDNTAVILIGIVSFADGTSDGVVSQCQSGHLLNRYLNVSPYNASTGAQNAPRVFRGLLSNIPVADTIGGDKFCIFFPGDVVVDDRVVYYTATAGGVGYYPCHLFNKDEMDEVQVNNGITFTAPWVPSFMQLVG